MNGTYHTPVLLQPCIEGLNIKPDGTYCDLTFGGGGHSKAILEKLGPEGRLIVFDQDEDAWRNRVEDKRVTFVRHNFRYLYHFTRFLEATPLDGILADLGVSSHHFDSPDRGFSFRFEGDLDMRMNRHTGITAAEVLNSYSEEDLTRIFKLYGEISSARRLVNEIAGFRGAKPFETTGELKDLAAKLAPRKDAARFMGQVFQALRIEVNGEMEVLREMLMHTVEVLKPGGRLVIMSYHSLEDRLVKNFFRTGEMDQSEVVRDIYGHASVPFDLITRKVVVPSDEEIEKNPRARSAKLRIAQKK
jgi:16S rRNA (cytosine1402-N4)-methyltransferase